MFNSRQVVVSDADQGGAEPRARARNDSQDDLGLSFDNGEESGQRKRWRNGVLILVSNRLGLKKVTMDYFGPVRQFFLSNLNCGIIGGRPSESYYLVGVQDQNIVLLDPHNALPAIKCDDKTIQEEHSQFHEKNAKKIPFQKLDPTMTFAFYIRNESEFATFKDW